MKTIEEKRIIAVRDRNQINIDSLTKSYNKIKLELNTTKEVLIEAKQLQSEVELNNIKSSLNSE